MAKETFYRQCNLSKGNSRTTGYIEERGAKVGAHVELLADDGALWEVTQVADKRIPQSYLRFKEGANKHASIA